MLLTPEKSMHIQNDIGADIIMALDDVVSSVAADDERFEEATHRTIRWIDRCIAAHARPREQALFGIVQGAGRASQETLRGRAARTRRGLAGVRHRRPRRRRGEVGVLQSRVAVRGGAAEQTSRAT